MAIDLPPVIPPQLSTQAYYEANYQRDSAVISGVIKGTSVRVLGNRYLSSQQVEQMLSAASLPSTFIKALAKTYYEDGHLLVKIRYYREGTTVTVMVDELALADVRGDKAISPYFEGLIGDQNLTMPEFHRAKALADIRAARTEINYSAKFEEINGREAALVFDSEPAAEPDSTDYIVEFNNRGSRFAGRYYGIAGIKHRFDNGAEASLAYQHAFSDWGESRIGKSLDRLKFGVDHPFTFGLYGVELDYIEYESESSSSQLTPATCTLLILGCTPASSSTSSTEFDAEIFQAAVHGKQFLYSTPSTQVALTQRLEYVDSTVEEKGGSEPALDENYQLAELGVEYSRRPDTPENETLLNLGLRLRFGLGGSGTLESYDEFSQNFAAQNPGAGPAPDVVPAARSGDFLVLKPSADYFWLFQPRAVLGFSLRGQIADEQLPQQQQYVLGGMETMSAYLPGVVLGDEGYHLKVEVTLQRDWLGFSWRPAAFIEYGATWFNDTSSDLSEEQRISDAGLKVSTDFGDGLMMELVAARPLSDDVSDTVDLEQAEADFYWRLRKVF